MRTKLKVRNDFFAASRAALDRFPAKGVGLGPPRLVENTAAAVALDEALSPLDRDEGNKKKAQIMVGAFEPGCRQATTRTGPHLIIDLNLPRLNAANEDEGTPPLSIRFCS
jgi:hypothetical protein